jgi:hypothetical protein
MKVKVVADLLDLGPVQEHYLRKLSGSFVLAPTRVEGTTMFVTARAFLDDHNLVMQRDHTMLVLEDIYAVGLKPILEGPRYDIQVTLAVHSVGPVQRELVEQAYRDYSGDSSKHPKALFSAAVDIQSYAAAPWTAMFRI